MIKVVIQRCCEWMRLVQVIYQFCEVPVLVSLSIINDEEWDLLQSASMKLCDNAPALSICNSTSSVLFSEAEVNVLVKVIEFYQEQLRKNVQKMIALDPAQTLLMKSQFALIKNNLLGYENKTEKPATAPKNCTNDSPNFN